MHLVAFGVEKLPLFVVHLIFLTLETLQFLQSDLVIFYSSSLTEATAIHVRATFKGIQRFDGCSGSLV